MRIIASTLWAVALVELLSTSALHAQELDPELVVAPTKARGVYEAGEPIAWSIAWRGRSPARAASYVLKRGGLTEVGRGDLTLADGKAQLDARLDEPGALVAEIAVTTEDGKQRLARGGAIVAPGEIKPSAERPADFDQFWDGKIAHIKTVAPNPQLEAKPCRNTGVDYFHVTLDGYQGAHIRGQLARPHAPDAAKKFPALFIPQWAGVYPLEAAWAIDRAAEGWLVLNILAHDLPIQEPQEFYRRQQFGGPLHDYWAIGADDREQSYYLRMYLSCFQALEYLASRPDWDGRTLAVTGDSQGGMQTLVAAALHPRVTAAMALVPAGCDFTGGDVGREPGWPKWLAAAAGKDPVKVRQASRYFDVVNFAPRVKCPALVGYGLIDDVCPPEGVQAAINLLAGPKEVIVLPVSGHQNVSGSQDPYYGRRHSGWFAPLLKGEAPPANNSRRIGSQTAANPS